MFAISHLFVFLNFAFAVTFMFGIGLRIGSPKELYQGGERGAMIRALLANVILVPLAAWIIHRFIPMRPELAMGFMLVAITPGGLFGIHFCHIAKGNIPYAVQLAFLLSLAAVLMVPVIAAVLLPRHLASRFLDLRIMFDLAIFAFLPLILGQIVRRAWPMAVRPIGAILNILNPLLFAGGELVGAKDKKFSIEDVGHEMLLAFGLLILASWAIGWLLGGRDVGRRKVLAIDSSLRNAAICWILVHRSFADIHVALAILAFNGIAVPMNFGFAVLARFLGKNNAKPRD